MVPAGGLPRRGAGSDGGGCLGLAPRAATGWGLLTSQSVGVRLSYESARGAFPHPGRSMRRQSAIIAILGCCWTARLSAQTAPEAPRTPLLERLIGVWTMTGTVRARPATYRLEA